MDPLFGPSEVGATVPLITEEAFRAPEDVPAPESTEACPEIHLKSTVTLIYRTSNTGSY